MLVGYETVVGYWPEKVLKRSDFAYLDKVIPEEQKNVLGVPEEVRRVEGKDGAEFLAEAVARKALDSAGLKASDIDCIVAEKSGGKYSAPGIGCFVHQILGLSDEAPVFDVQQGGASFPQASYLAWCLVLSGEFKRVLVVEVAALSIGGLDRTSPMSMAIGDGACAAIVSSQNLKCEFLAHGARTEGSIYDDCVATMKSVEHPELLKEGERKFGLFLSLTPRFIEYQVKIGRDYVRDTLERAARKVPMKLSDLDYVVAHQASLQLMHLWMEGMEEAGVGREKWKESYQRFGGVLNVDVGTNLAELWEDGKLKKGSLVGLFGPGGGGHTSGLILRWLA
jgi:3-oxoacyl-[acyl-carrier-protein] synthase III